MVLASGLGLGGAHPLSHTNRRLYQTLFKAPKIAGVCPGRHSGGQLEGRFPKRLLPIRRGEALLVAAGSGGNSDGVPPRVMRAEDMSDALREWVQSSPRDAAGGAPPLPPEAGVRDVMETYIKDAASGPESTLSRGQQLPIQGADASERLMNGIDSLLAKGLEGDGGRVGAALPDIADGADVTGRTLVGAGQGSHDSLLLQLLDNIYDMLMNVDGLREWAVGVKQLGDSISTGMERNWSATPIGYQILAYLLAGAGALVLLKEKLPEALLEGSLADWLLGPLPAGRSFDEEDSKVYKGSTSATAFDADMQLAPSGTDRGPVLPASFAPSGASAGTSTMPPPRPSSPRAQRTPSGGDSQRPVTPTPDVSWQAYSRGGAASPSGGSSGVVNSWMSRASMSGSLDGSIDEGDMEAMALREARRVELAGAQQRRAVKEKLRWISAALGRSAAMVPGGEPLRIEVDALIEELEGLQASRPTLGAGGADGAPTSVAAAAGDSEQALLGTWSLNYTSNGRANRVNMASQILELVDNVPGFGVQDVQQVLTPDPRDPSNVIAMNTATLGFGPFGAWRISVSGFWRSGADGIASVELDSFAVEPVELLGLSIDGFAQVCVTIPPALRTTAEWRTTYLDEDCRVGRSPTGTVFLFQRDVPQSRAGGVRRSPEPMDAAPGGAYYP